MFNALKYTQALEKAGFSRDQAEVSVNFLIDAMTDNFATKSDLKETRLELDSTIRGVKSELQTSIQELRSEVQASISGLRSEMRASISDLRSEMQTSIGELSSELRSEVSSIRSEMKELEYRMTLKLGTMGTIAIGVTATLVRLLAPIH